MTQRQGIQTVVLCDGKGSRLREYTEAIPKVLVAVGARPILWHIMKSYAEHGFAERLMTGCEQVAYPERRRLPGASVVVCGTAARANLAKGQERLLLHLFDSFQDMPEPRRDRDGPEVAQHGG